MRLQRFHRTAHPSHRRGSAVVFLLMMVGLLFTGMMATMAMQSGVQAQSVDISLKRNAAFYAAEAGVQQAVWNMNYNQTWMSTLPQTTTLPNGCKYTISTVGTVNWPTLPVTFLSVGTSADGTIVSQSSIMVTSSATAPGIAIGGGLADSGTLNIAGSVEVVGNVTRSGTMNLTTVAGQPTAALESMGSFSSSGTFKVPGDLEFNSSVTSSGSVTAGGNVQAGQAVSHSGTWAVSGSTQSYDNPDLAFTAPTVNTASLISQATSNGTVISGGAKSNLTINFNNSPNGIVYINGNTTLTGTTTIVGTGTLVVQGTLTVSGFMGTAGTPAPINIVTTGNATMSATLYMNGALCVGGALTKSGTTSITGVMVVQSSMTGSGNITLNYAAPPSFIQYSGGSSSGSIQTTNFSGPVY